MPVPFLGVTRNVRYNDRTKSLLLSSLNFRLERERLTGAVG